MPRTRKPQRYKLTWEFVLRDPSQYAFTKMCIEEWLRQFSDRRLFMQSDYLAIEKVPEGEEPK